MRDPKLSQRTTLHRLALVSAAPAIQLHRDGTGLGLSGTDIDRRAVETEGLFALRAVPTSHRDLYWLDIE